MKIRFSKLIILSAAVFSVTTAAYSQMTAVRVLDNMQAAYEESVKNINDYTVVTDLYTAQYKKFTVDGRPVFKSRVQIRGAEQFGAGAVTSSSMGHSDFFDEEIYTHMRQNARYEGTETVEGKLTHVLFVAEMEPVVEDEETETAKNVYFYVDADKWILRKMKFEVEVEQEGGEKHTVEPEMHFLDYRSVEGLQIPYKTVMDMGDMGSTMTPEEREETRQSLAEMKQQLEEMPAQQRRMVERMMRPQIERLEKMLEGDKLQIVIEVEEVKVNTGLSDDLFE